MNELYGLGNSFGINLRETPEMTTFIEQLNQITINPKLSIEVIANSICSYSLHERYQKRQHTDQIWFKYNKEIGQ
jgi:hypothetical protein